MTKDLGSENFWRCLCGNVHNSESVAHCQDCGKRRWSDLGISHKGALWLIQRLRFMARAEAA
jgi:hypothetical protein